MPKINDYGLGLDSPNMDFGTAGAPGSSNQMTADRPPVGITPMEQFMDLSTGLPSSLKSSAKR